MRTKPLISFDLILSLSKDGARISGFFQRPAKEKILNGANFSGALQGRLAACLCAAGRQGGRGTTPQPRSNARPLQYDRDGLRFSKGNLAGGCNSTKKYG